MGGSSSKHNAAAPSSSSLPSASPSLSPSPSQVTSSVVQRTPSYRSRVFQSSCLGSHSEDLQVSGHQTKENGSNSSYSKNSKTNSGEVRTRCSRRVKAEQPSDDWGQPSCPEILSRGANSSSRVVSLRSFNSTSTFSTRCGCLPGNMSFRLYRSNSVGSSGGLCSSSKRFTVSNDEDEDSGRSSISDVSANGEQPRNCDFFPGCFSHQGARHQNFLNNNLQFDSPAATFSNDWQLGQHITSVQDNEVQSGTSPSSLRNHICREHFDTRPSNRRIAAREPIDRNVRFSRTLSVGRLRERSSSLDLGFCPYQQDQDLLHASQHCGTPARNARSGLEENIMISPASSGHPQLFATGSPFGTRDREGRISRARQARYLDLLEHRSNFLEHRRRIRSQARALQRLGSRFQHVSGHERSCILSGQYRTGRCTCRLGTRGNDSNNETTARGSISRIVMLAEALFEVLDEIHQQSVVLSSPTSVSPTGSIPAPDEIVESLPVKLYSRVQKHHNQENEQCYICLIEYEEGDIVRILPCHHEFHGTCIDKWLKEIHRVCPLCRGDICRPQLSASEG